MNQQTTNTRLFSPPAIEPVLLQDFLASYHAKSEYFLGAIVTVRAGDGPGSPMQVNMGPCMGVCGSCGHRVCVGRVDMRSRQVIIVAMHGRVWVMWTWDPCR